MSALAPLARGTCRCWHVDLAHVDASSVDALARLLPRSEIERAERYGRLLDRKRTIIAHASLRLLMREVAGVGLDSIEIDRTAQGKPRFVSDEYSFNISHSGDQVLMVIARGGEVGIDVERVREVPDLPEIIRRTFHADEARVLAGMPEARLSAAFFRLWVCKEAIAKALGLGLALDMATYRVADDLEGPRLMETCEAWTREPWTLRTLSLSTEYTAAVAAPWRMEVLGCSPFSPRSLVASS